MSLINLLIHLLLQRPSSHTINIVHIKELRKPQYLPSSRTTHRIRINIPELQQRNLSPVAVVTGSGCQICRVSIEFPSDELDHF